MLQLAICTVASAEERWQHGKLMTPMQPLHIGTNNATPSVLNSSTQLHTRRLKARLQTLKMWLALPHHPQEDLSHLLSLQLSQIFSNRKKRPGVLTLWHLSLKRCLKLQLFLKLFLKVAHQQCQSFPFHLLFIQLVALLLLVLVSPQSHIIVAVPKSEQILISRYG